MGESTPKLYLHLAFVLATSLWSVSAQNASLNRREGKVFSLFNVVTFVNTQCTSNDVTNGDPRQGTCFTNGECVARNGLLRGTCAAGFGVCCVFEVQNTGSQINQNCTYIVEPTVDQANAGAARTIMYTINRINSNICSLRLDFETFDIQGPAVGGPCLDQFVIQTKSTPILICGQNSGEHIYVELGALTSSRIDITLPATTGTVNREWDIKVAQIPCGATFAAPTGCLQYHTENTGRIISFNFNGPSGLLPLQRYSTCIRQESGFCCVRYEVCPMPPGGFTLDNDIGLAMSALEMVCSRDYIAISGSTNTQTRAPGAAVRNKYCAPFLNFNSGEGASSFVHDCSPPFAVAVVTDNNVFGPPPNRGLCLKYSQIVC